jgi:hypothetical protein
MRLSTATCCASFWPKKATSGATMLSSFVTTVHTPAKWAGTPLGAFEDVAESGHRDGGGEAVGIDLLDGRREEHVDSEPGRGRRVLGFRARVGVEVAGLLELPRIDEEPDDHLVGLLARGAHQRLVAGVEGAHGRDEADGATA